MLAASIFCILRINTRENQTVVHLILIMTIKEEINAIDVRDIA